MDISAPVAAQPYVFYVRTEILHEHFAVYVDVDDEEPFTTYAYVYRIHYFGDVKVFHRVYNTCCRFSKRPQKKLFARDVLAEYVEHLNDLPF